MNQNREEILIENAREYYSSGKGEYGKGRYNSSVVLFFKSLIALCDLYVLRQTGESPSSHIKRFNVLKEKFPEIYDIVDKDFPFYQSSYVQVMTKELSEVIAEDVRYISEKVEVTL